MPESPEDKARREIDVKLTAAGWVVQDQCDLDLTAGPGIVVRNFTMKPGHGFADYLLYVERVAVGAVEAKAKGTLRGVEVQTAKYSYGLPDSLPARRRPLPFLFESNGSIIQFTNNLDPAPRSRKIFNFPRPETLAGILAQPKTLRAALRELPRVTDRLLWPVQARAISGLDASVARADQRALLKMTMGSGKTYIAVTACYRYLRYASSGPILFLVDRRNLGKQAYDEFANYQPPDEARKFTELFTVQQLTANAINPAAKVVITTIQRLFSMLKGETEFDPENEETSAWDVPAPWLREPPKVVYNPAIPPEFFNFIVIDECHRSIYELWSQVLLYFDAFYIGLSATPTGRTLAFFNQNLILDYGHQEAVTDQVNVGFDVYRIRTRITEQGETVEAGRYVDKRHRLTRAERLEYLDHDLTYTAKQLDADVVNESQIRTIIRAFRDKVLPEAFPGRQEVPKTLIFAKNDSHADDIVKIVREEFSECNAFCEKLTYRTGHVRVTRKVPNDDGTECEIATWERRSDLADNEDLLASFRNSFHPRIAVTVDLIGTGIDVKPLEILLFLRNVKSAGYFEQMKGRGVRVFSPDKLRAVTPSAKAKDRFIIVDAVGVCEQDKTESTPLDRQPSATLDQLLDHVAKGGTHPDALTTLAGRFARLQREFTAPQLAELKHLAGGKSLGDLAHDLLHAVDPDAQLEVAKKLPGAASPPTEEQVNAAARQLARTAIEPLLTVALRRRILEIRAANEQTLDRHNLDELLHAAFDEQAKAKAEAKIKDLRQWMGDHRHEIGALQALYAGTRPLKLSLADLRTLKEVLTLPPVAASPAALWRAFTIAEAPVLADAAAKPRRGGDQLADLVNLLRHALKPELPLVPYADEVRERYAAWRHDKEQAGVQFTREQSEWLDRIAEHIATSLSIEPEDFDMGWFGQHGSLGQAHALFGDQLHPLLAEVNDRLAA